MQSFQDFIQSRRQKSGDVEDLEVLKRSRSEHASEVPAAGPQLQRAASKTSPGNLGSSLPNQASPEAAAAGAHAAAVAAAAAHTTTTVSGAAAAAAADAGGSRYLSRSSTAAGSTHKLSDGLSSTLQQLLSPQRSAALTPLSNSSSLRASSAAAGAAAADLHAAALAAATMAGGQQGQLARVTSSRSAGQIGTGSFSRLQPLSIADALQSPLSRSTAATPPGAHTPTGARTPVGGRRYPAAAAPVADAGGDAAAAGGGRSPEFAVTRVLQDAAVRAAALNRSTTLKSQASQGDMQPHAGLQASTLSSLQQLLSQQHSQHEQQQQQHWLGGQPTHEQQQQQQSPGQQQWLQPEQQQHGNAAALLNDLDRRFANIKDSLRGVFPQDSIQQRFAAAGAGGRVVAPVGVAAGPAAAAGGLPLSAAAGTAGAADYGLFRGSSDGRAAKYQHVMTEPYSLDDESSNDSSSGNEGSPRQSPHQAQRQRSLLSPRDSSSIADSSEEEEQQLSGMRRGQQQQDTRHRAGQLPLQHHPKDACAAADVTLDGCVAAAAAGRQQGKPAVIAAAAAAAAAATAAAADGSLPIEVDVKCGEECGEEGELRGATAHFIVSHVMSPDAAGSRRAQQQQQQHKQHLSRRQLQLPQESSLPSTINMLGAEQSGSLSFPATSPAGTAADWDSQHSSASLAAAAAAGAPQPRSVKPRPSVCQRQQQQQQQGLRGPAAGKGAAGRPSAAAAAVAAAGAGVLDAEGDRWCSNALILAKQQAKELQQQNDALVRVLERERQQHKKTRQQVSELRADLQEVQAEWEVKLQSLRQEKLAAEAQLRRALAGGEQQEMLAACDAALAASAARAEEAQAAASRLATQVTELELQVQQLQLICGTTAAGGAADGSSGGSAAAKPTWRPLSGSSSSGGGGGSVRADGAATLRALASAECRSPDKRAARCRAAFAPGAAPDGCGGRGVRALRQHQAHLEAQLAKLSEELSQLQRENVRLLRYKKQYEVAAASLASAGGAKAAAESYAQEAGLRAAAAGGRADKLELQVEELQQQVQQLKAERDRAQLHLQIAQQQQRLHASLGAGAANNSSGGTLPAGAGAEQFMGSSFLSSAALAGTGGSPAWEAAFGGMGAVTAGVPVPDPAVRGQPGSVPSMQLQQQTAELSPAVAAAVTAAAGGAGAARAAAAPAVSAAEREALTAVQQLRTSLPDAPPVQGQLASLMSAIQAGVQERQVLAAQGRVLLDMLVGSN